MTLPLKNMIGLEIKKRLEAIDNQQAQIDQLVIDGDSSPESAQARVDGDGNTYTTLKQRLDTKDAAINQKVDDNQADTAAQLAEEMQQIYKSTVEGYGLVQTRRTLYAGGRIQVVVVGDSTSYGSGASDSALDWESLTRAALLKKFPNASIIWTNSAVGGTSSDYLLAHWDELVTPFEPTLIVVGHGTNDIHMDAQHRLDNYATIKQKADALGAEVLLVTNFTVQMTPEPYGNIPDTELELRDQVAEQTRQIAKQYRWGLADAYNAWRKWLTDRSLDLTSTLLLYDHIHPNDLLHAIAAYTVTNAFLDLPQNMIFMDERFGGKGYALYGTRTFRDVEHMIGIMKGWGAYDLGSQLVDWGGLWWVRDYRGKGFLKAKLYGTQAVAGDEPYQNNYKPTWHIIPKDKDYLELEDRDMKKVWFAMDGSSTTATTFRVLVDGTEVHQFAVSSISSQPIEIPFNTTGTKFFRRGNHTIRVERVDTIPPTDYVVFHGFVVQYYKDDEPEIFETPANQRQVVTASYQDLDVGFASPNSRQIASNIGITVPFGTSEFDNGFIQGLAYKPSVMYLDFYGDHATFRFRSITNDNYVGIYIDGTLKAWFNTKNPSAGALMTAKYTELGTGIKHRAELIAINGEIDLQSVLFSDTL